MNASNNNAEREYNAATTANAERLNKISIIESGALAHIQRNKKEISFEEILDFGARREKRTLPIEQMYLFSCYLDARSINSTAPAALFELILSGKPLTYDLFDEAKNLKAKRSNSWFDLLPDYTPEQLEILAQNAKDYHDNEGAKTVFETVQNVPVGLEIRIATPQTGYQYALVIQAEENGSTFIVSEDGLQTLFNPEYELCRLPQVFKNAIFAELEKWHEQLEDRKNMLANKAAKAAERAKEKAAKAAELSEKLAAKIADYCTRYALELPEAITEPKERWVWITEQVAAKKAEAKAAKAEAKAAAEKAKADKAEAAAKAKAEAKPAEPKAAKAKKGNANTVNLMAEAAAAAANALTAK